MKKFLVLLVLAGALTCTSLTLDGTLYTPAVIAGEGGEYVTIAPITPETPGHAAYEAYRAQFPSVAECSPAWHVLPAETRHRWDCVALEVVKAAFRGIPVPKRYSPL